MSGVFKFNKWLSLCIITALIVCGSFVVSYAGSDCPQGGEHDYTVTIVKRATENTDGVRKYVCSKCGDTYTEAIPATGHKWSSWVTDKKATCTDKGHAYRKCIKHTEFTHYEYKTLPALGHDYQVKITAPTSTSAGMKVYTCSRCGDTYSVMFGSATGGNSSTATIKSVSKTDKDNVSKLTDDGKSKAATSKSNTAAATKGTSPTTAAVPFGAADAAILGANGVAILWFILLLLPLIRVMFWVAKKRREAEEDQ